ncbi:MAG: dihydropteroate synthase [Planctomycetaceae bacterium]|nr:dihydropteroate synthase [Planctomycetaceae bacterium]
MSRERILFVTGRLAERSLRRVVGELGPRLGFDYEVHTLGISVAALMHCDWVARKLEFDGQFDRVILPGWCQGDLQMLADQFGTPFECGPKNVFDLPMYFGSEVRVTPDLSQYDIEIIAEINHAPRLNEREIMGAAESFRNSGADVIDVGCIAGESWAGTGDAIRLLRREGFRVSIDSFDRSEVESAVEAGAELVLSCNGENLSWAADLGVELVAIPDTPHDSDSLDRTVEALQERGAIFRVDPILEPIGFGFAASLSRYFDVRRRWPDVEMMMGIGNITELTEADTAGMNLLLAGLCQELGIRSVLTTEVINWARTSVREFDLARSLVHYSLANGVLPKHLDPQLVMLRDPRIYDLGEEELQSLAAQLRDPNFRIFVERGEIHVMNRDGYWRGSDPYELFEGMIDGGTPIDPKHAFYLGYELSKAVTALTLGKQFTQDESLQWGFLTIPETSAKERQKACGPRPAGSTVDEGRT